MPAWGSTFVKGEEHNERVGMTEFRKSMAKLMGPYRFDERDEKRFFKYPPPPAALLAPLSTLFGGCAPFYFRR